MNTAALHARPTRNIDCKLREAPVLVDSAFHRTTGAMLPS